MLILKHNTIAILLTVLLALQFAMVSSGHASQEHDGTAFQKTGIAKIEQISPTAFNAAAMGDGNVPEHSSLLDPSEKYSCPEIDHQMHGVVCASGCTGAFCQPFVMANGHRTAARSLSEAFPIMADIFSQLHTAPEHAPPRA